MMIQRRNRASLRWFSKNISLITLLWTFCTNPLSYHARVLIFRGSHLTPFPYVRESHTRCCGTGFLRVRVWVILKFPTGHPCPSLPIWEFNPAEVLIIFSKPLGLLTFTHLG